MKSKIKRHSRSVISVVLALCMLLSCMTAGIIMTDAAKIDSESVGYSGARVKGSWDSWTLHNISSTAYSVNLAGNSTYSFVFLAGDNNDQFSSNATISGTTNYNFSRNDNDAITLRTAAAGSYKFSFTGYDGGQTSMSVRIEFPAEATWTVVGECGKSANTTNLFGTAWAPTLNSNRLQKVSGTSRWEWTKKNVYLTATDTISYKIAQNSEWDVVYPASANATKSVSTSGYYDVIVTYDENTHAVGMTLTPSTLYTLTVPTVANAVVTASYGTATAQEGGTLSNLPPGAKVNVSITPSTGYMASSVTASGCTVNGSNSAWTITLPTASATSSTKDKTFAVSMTTVGTKKIYFNNNASEYNMVSAYVRRSSDGYEPFGVYPGATMTRLPNSDIWEIEIPGDCDQVRFTGDNGQNTGTTMLTIGSSNPPMYTAGPNKASPQSNGSWGKYYPRTNEYTVSKGSTLNNNDLFTGIKATFYDYYVDSELSGIAVGGNDTSTSAGWLTGIANDEFSWRNNGWKWNPYTVLNSALSEYNKNISNSSTYNNTTYGLYFGNLNVTTGSNPLDMDNSAIGKGNSTTIKNYTGWLQNANGSVALGNAHNAATGLSGLTLARNQIHHYKNGNTNQNGMDMGMFNEDFLSGWNNVSKPLATILRSPVFPVATRSQKTLVLDISSASNTWGSSNAVMAANFHNGNTTSGNLRVTMTSLGNGLWSVAVPAGYSQVEWLRLNPSDGNAWNYYNAGSIGDNNKYKFNSVGTDWNTVTGTWSNDTNYPSHTYYEYDSTDGKDNAYITNIDKSGKTAQLNYYNNSNKVYSAENTAGFFPFDYNNLNSHTDTNSTSGDVSHDLGFGMKLEIPFTLEAGGAFSDGMHQVFEFSGDDDLWVFIDGQLVLDLGGAHARTEGKIDFATRTVTATQAQAVGASSRNSAFTWFDNNDPDAIHTMTLYYLERGMYQSNLKFGFSFHAIPNQLKTEKKVRTANINQGFFVTNSTTQSNLWIDDHQRVTWFEQAFRNDDFIITHKEGGTNITNKAYTLTSNGANSATATTTRTTTGTVTNGTYKLHNDDIAYFKGQFTSNSLMTISESDDNTSGHINQFSYDKSVDVYDDANVDSNNNSYRFTTVSGTPTAAGTVSGNADSGASFLFKETAPTGLENLNIRTRFTNQMKSHDLKLIKTTNVPNDTTDFTINVKFNFDNEEAGVQKGYVAYPLWCEKTDANGTKTSVQMSTSGDVTLKPGEVLLIPKVPENARVQVSERLATSSEYACTGIKIYDASGNEEDWSIGASSSTSGGYVTKTQSFTMAAYDMVAEVNNEKADPVTITHRLHPDSIGTGTCTVSVQVKNSSNATLATYPSSGTTDSVTVPNTFIKRGSTDKLVITLTTVPTGPSVMEHFYEAIEHVITRLAASGTPYTATITENSTGTSTATVTINISALFDSTTNKQKYTTLPFYSKLDLPKYDLTITKFADATTSETFDFEVYKKTGYVYEKITTDPGFIFLGTGTGTFANEKLTLSSGMDAKLRVTYGEIYRVIEIPKSGSVFEYDEVDSSVTPTSESIAIENGFENIIITDDTTVEIDNKQQYKSLTITKKLTTGTDSTTNFTVTVTKNGSAYTGAYTDVAGVDQTTSTGTFTLKQDQSITLNELMAGDTVVVTETNIPFNYEFSKATLGSAVNTDVSGTPATGYTYTVADNTDLKIWNAPITYHYEVWYHYSSYRNLHQEQQYKVTGDFDKNTPKVTDYLTISDAVEDWDSTTNPRETVTAYWFKGDQERSNFINILGPYENNFMKTISWNTAMRSDGNPSGMTIRYQSSSHKYVIDVYALVAEHSGVDLRFNFPYSHGNEAQSFSAVSDSDGKVHFNPTQTFVEIPNLNFGTWFSTNGAKFGDGTTPTFVTAPMVIYNGDQAMGFKYWTVKTYGTDLYPSTEYTKCYFRDFNLSIYQDSIVEPHYENITAEQAANYHPNPHDVAIADGNANGAVVTFLENSRNQYNVFNDNISQSTRKYMGDRIYTDFVLSYASADDLKFQDYADDEYTAGLAIQKVAALESDGTNVNTSSTYYANKYGDSLTNMTYNGAAFSQASLVDFIKGTPSYDDSIGLERSEFDANKLDNKNRIQYYYSYSVRSHSDLTDNHNKDYVYRAFAYMKDKNDNVTMVSQPLYFTFYDMASIKNAQDGAGQ